MGGAIGAAAAFLGFLVRVVLWCSVRCLPLVAIGLIVFGVWLYDHRAAPIAGGVLLILLLAPSDGRKR